MSSGLYIGSTRGLADTCRGNGSSSVLYDVLSEAGLRGSMLHSRQPTLEAGDTADVGLVMYLSHEEASRAGRASKLGPFVCIESFDGWSPIFDLERPGEFDLPIFKRRCLS